MTSPPLQNAAPNPVNGHGHTGTPRGKVHRYDEREQKWFRVRVDGDGQIDPKHSSDEGSQAVVLDPRLSYVLIARDGRRIPINTTELADWLNRHYRLGDKNKAGIPTVYVRHEAKHGMWPGARVDTVPLHRGAWRIAQSDDSVLLLPQMHTLPLSELEFQINQRGIVRAHYPGTKNTPVAGQIAKPGSYEGSNTRILEDQ